MSNPRKILPSITTQGLTTSSWRNKIEELISLQIDCAALFLTGLRKEHERWECYKLLEQVRRYRGLSIPFVHAIANMQEHEFWHLIDTFGVEYFNLHPGWQYPLEHPLSSRLRQRILIENSCVEVPLMKHDTEGFAGICFDLSHLHDTQLYNRNYYAQLVGLAHCLPVLANHISVVGPSAGVGPGEIEQRSYHDADYGSMEYLSKLSPRTFSQLCAVELENDLSTQLQLIPRVRELLSAQERALALQKAA